VALEVIEPTPATAGRPPGSPFLLG